MWQRVCRFGMQGRLLRLPAHPEPLRQVWCGVLLLAQRLQNQWREDRAKKPAPADIDVHVVGTMPMAWTFLFFGR